MAYSTQNPYTMSIKQIKLRRAGSTVELPAAQQASISPMLVSGMLRGNSKIVTANAYIEGAEGQFQMGGWPLVALPIMTGMAAPSASGTTPNQVTRYALPASTAFPYFEMAGRTQDSDGGDVHIYVPRCKIMSTFQLQIQDGANFTAPQISFNAVPDASNVAFYIDYNETTADVSAAFAAGSSKSVSALAVADGIGTATSTSHGFAAGQWVTISGATDQPLIVNGLKQVIDVADANTFTFACIGAVDDAAIAGTIVANY